MTEPADSGRERRRLLGPRLDLAACVVIATATGFALHAGGLSQRPAMMASVAVLMALCWVLEVVPIPVTSLFPLALFPLLDLGTLDEVGASYGKPTIFLFLGGFLLALGLQRSGVHKRIALGIVAIIGSRPSRLVLGFMIASGFLSMWISNTASVLVMMPIGLAVLAEAKEHGVAASDVSRVGTAMMLGIAYAADIGGMATPVGTPPNLVFLELYQGIAPEGAEVGFGQWMTLGIPLSVAFMSSGWLLLTKVLFRFEARALFGGSDIVRSQLEALGPLRRDELVSALIFAGTALAWMTGADLRMGEWSISGWRSALGLEAVGDASVAVLSASILFVIPSRDHKGEALMTWETTKQIPWGLLLLFGGGFALAAGFKASGLSVAIGDVMRGLAGLHPIVVVLIVSLMVTLLTELTSNTATTTLILPILAETATAIGVDPLVLMIPATLSASCAFMMPVASPTQAIVFGSGYVNIRQMVRAGIGFNLLGVVLVTLIFALLSGPIFGASIF